MPHLVVARPEPPPNVFIIQNLNFETEILLQVFYQHDKEWQFDTKSFRGIPRTGDVSCADIRAHDLQHARTNVIVSNPLDVSVAHCKASNTVDLLWEIRAR